MSVVTHYPEWHRINDLLVTRIPDFTTETLALRADPSGWPIWALVSHLAGTRVYWLCHQFGEPGIEGTPFAGVTEGWEDTPDHPRSSEELVDALERTWHVVTSVLERWTPESLPELVSLNAGASNVTRSRAWVLGRLLMHESFHLGDISTCLAHHGLPSMDPWDRPPAR
ncbi:MAG: DinB family protein [Candidatus Dormibacteria bacterium]